MEAVMKQMALKQGVFYSFIFLFGLIYQPVWVYENFWSKAKFYEVLPFDFPYIGFILIYSSLWTIFCFFFVKLAKKYL
jgi:hypothetical protein